MARCAKFVDALNPRIAPKRWLALFYGREMRTIMSPVGCFGSSSSGTCGYVLGVVWFGLVMLASWISRSEAVNFR